jgi:hypothetical protein
MFDDLQSWWQSTPPEMQMALQAASAVLLAFVAGHFLAALVVRTLRNHQFDALLRLPTSSLPPPNAERGITPTVVAGYLVRLTAWAVGVWWVAHHYGWHDLATKLALIIGRTWALTAVLVAALTLGGLLAQRLIDCLQGLPGKDSPHGHGIGAGNRGVAGIVAAGAYVFVVLLALLIAADLFDWPLTRNSAQALWQFAQHLMIAGAALFIGSLGARWARELVTVDASASPEKKAGQYTSLGIMAATTVLAVAVLLSSAGVVFGLAALAVLGILGWLARGYLPDVVAGLQLRAQHVREVWFEGVAWQIADVGFLSTHVSRAGEICRVQNRLVLEARLHGAPAEAKAGQESA